MTTTKRHNTLTAQIEELKTAEQSFTRMPNSCTYRSDLYPHHAIMGNPIGSGWYIFRNGERAPLGTAYSFDGAVSRVVVEAKA